jgi:uncharacterized protein (TIGR03437 family)
MKMRLALLLLASVSLPAQQARERDSWFTGLAPSDDGQVLYFGSPLVLRGSIPTLGQRVYRYTSAGIELVATLPPPQAGGQYSGVESSGDSFTVAWWDLAPQATGPGSFGSVYAGALTAGGVTQTLQRAVALSGNGRYAALFYGSDPSGADMPPTLVDRVTGAQYSAPSLPYPHSFDIAGARQTVTSNGQLLLKQLTSGGDIQLSLWSPAGKSDFPTSRPFRLAEVSDDGTRIVWTDGIALHVIDVPTGLDSVIATFPIPSIRNLGIDKAADMVAVVADHSPDEPPQLYLVRADGSGPKAIAPREHGYREAALSGDGRFVFGATLDGALVRVDTTTDETSEIVTGPPWVEAIANSPSSTSDLVPGSQYRITGGSLNDTMSLGTNPLRILSASPTELRFQVPFEAPLGDSTLHFNSVSPFEQPIPVRVRAIAPVVLATMQGNSRASATNVNPGEILHLYMAGLGAVSPPVASGAPAPAHPRAAVVSPVSAVLSVQVPDGQHGPYVSFDVPVLFAGLAPGMIGIYQVDLKLPHVTGVEPGQHAAYLVLQSAGATAYANNFTVTTK